LVPSWTLPRLSTELPLPEPLRSPDWTSEPPSVPSWTPPRSSREMPSLEPFRSLESMSELPLVRSWTLPTLSLEPCVPPYARTVAGAASNRIPALMPATARRRGMRNCMTC
jgi:hypothetical protein